MNVFFRLYYTTGLASLSRIINTAVLTTLNMIAPVLSILFILLHLSAGHTNYIHSVESGLFFGLSALSLFVVVAFRIMMFYIPIDSLLTCVASTGAALILFGCIAVLTTGVQDEPTEAFLIRTVQSLVTVMYTLVLLFATGFTRSLGTPPDLSHILIDDKSLDFLRGFLTLEHSEENINFLEATKDYRTRPEYGRALTIAQQYLSPDAPTPINITDDSRRVVDRHIAQLAAGIRQARSTGAPPPMFPVTLFGPAELEIFDNLQVDGFKRFRGSRQYIKMEFELFRRNLLMNEALIARWVARTSWTDVGGCDGQLSDNPLFHDI